MKNLKGSAVNKIIKNTTKNVETLYNVFKKKFIFFALKKLKKTPSKVAQKYSTCFLHYCPELLKQPKQKNSCTKMWLIDQLYLKLGLGVKRSAYLLVLVKYLVNKSS